MSRGSYRLPNPPQHPDDQKIFESGLKVGFNLYLQSAGRTKSSRRQSNGLPSRESVLAEAGARGCTKLTQWRFQNFWPTQGDYWGDLAVYAHSRDYQQQCLYRLRQKLIKKATRLAQEGGASLSSLILDGSIANIRRRIRLVGRMRTIHGMPISAEHRTAALQAERWCHDRHNAEWSRCYRAISEVLRVPFPEPLIQDFTLFATCLAESLAHRAYLEEATDLSGISPVETYGEILSQNLVHYLSEKLPHIEFHQPWLSNQGR